MNKYLLPLVGCFIMLTSCTHKVKVDPIKVEPIYVTMDIRIRVDRDLQDFFSFEDRMGKKSDEKSVTIQPPGKGDGPSGK